MAQTRSNVQTAVESHAGSLAAERGRVARPAVTHPLLHLQQTVGNQAVLGLLRHGMLQTTHNRRHGFGGAPGPRVAPLAVREALRSPGQPLDAATRTFFETRFRRDFSHVRTHTGPAAAESARLIDAAAYAVGHDIVFGAGRYTPGTSAGRKLIAHELSHTVQQEGTSPPTPAGLEVSEPGEPAELEADQASEAVLRGQAVALSPGRPPSVARQPRPPGGTSTLPREGLPTKADVIRQHQFQQRRVADLIQKGLRTTPRSTNPADTDLLFRNSCEWIVAGKSSLVILTPTHDAATRRTGSLAYFDRQVKYPAVGGDYAEQPAPGDQDHIVYAPPNWKGGMSANQFDLLDPAYHTDEELKGTFIHEVQHAADQTFWGRTQTPPPGRVEGSPGLPSAEALTSATRYNDYQSEFRAYWIEAPEGSPQDRFGSSRSPATNTRPVTWVDPQAQRTFSIPTHFRNARQEKIFWHLVRWYDWLEIPRNYTQDEHYRSMVDAFAQPVGINLVNSVRIQALTDVLQTCTPAMGLDAPEVRGALAKADLLDDADRNFLRDTVSAQPFWTLAARVLSSDALAELRKRVLRAPATPQPLPRVPSPRRPLFRPRTQFTREMERSAEGM